MAIRAMISTDNDVLPFISDVTRTTRSSRNTDNAVTFQYGYTHIPSLFFFLPDLVVPGTHYQRS